MMSLIAGQQWGCLFRGRECGAAGPYWPAKHLPQWAGDSLQAGQEWPGPGRTFTVEQGGRHTAATCSRAVHTRQVCRRVQVVKYSLPTYCKHHSGACLSQQQAAKSLTALSSTAAAQRVTASAQSGCSPSSYSPNNFCNDHLTYTATTWLCVWWTSVVFDGLCLPAAGVAHDDSQKTSGDRQSLQHHRHRERQR